MNKLKYQKRYFLCNTASCIFMFIIDVIKKKTTRSEYSWFDDIIIFISICNNDKAALINFSP